MRKVILTFDDGFAAQYHVAMPILKKYGHNATFFVCGAFIDHPTVGHLFMDWNHVKLLHDDGFEIGSHLYLHGGMTDKNIKHILNINKLNDILIKYEVPKPISLSYPGFHVDESAIEVVKKAGFRYARAGCEKTMEFMDFQTGGSGPHYNHLYDNPYNINCSGIFGEKFGYDDFVKSLEEVGDEETPVYCFHSFTDYGLPEAPATDISIESFDQCMKYLSDNNFKGIALKDITK